MQEIRLRKPWSCIQSLQVISQISKQCLKDMNRMKVSLYPSGKVLVTRLLEAMTLVYSFR